MRLLVFVRERGSERVRVAAAAVEDGLREIGMLLERLAAAGFEPVYDTLSEDGEVAVVSGKLEGRVDEARRILRAKADNMVKIRMGGVVTDEVFYVSRGGVTAVLDVLPSMGKAYLRVYIPLYPFAEE